MRKENSLFSSPPWPQNQRKSSNVHSKEKEILPSHMCLNAKEAAAAESSEILMPLTRISITDGRNESPLDEASNHFE